MIRKLVPALLALVAFLGGAVAGDFLKAPASADAAGEAAAHEGEAATTDGEHATPAAAAHSDEAESAAPAHGASSETSGGTSGGEHGKTASGSHGGGHGGSHGGGHGGEGAGSGDPSATGWFQFPQQFFVPVLHSGRLDSTMVLTLSAEMPAGAAEKVYAHELKLRDALLRQLLIHANTGGFDGNFTSEGQLRGLRGDLTATMQAVVPEITGTLIGDITRQER